MVHRYLLSQLLDGDGHCVYGSYPFALVGIDRGAPHRGGVLAVCSDGVRHHGVRSEYPKFGTGGYGRILRFEINVHCFDRLY